ncbi:MAG: hypothetical protein GY910_11040 [bacterium]|nr:hypothetical protein [bacterium]
MLLAKLVGVHPAYGPSSKAFLVVPLVGAVFSDLLYAGTINLFIGIIRNHLL